MDLLLLQGLGFSFGLANADVRLHLHTHIYIYISTYSSCIHVYVAGLVWRHTHRYHPHYASKKREETAVRWEEECQDSFVRPGLEIQGGVLLLFSLHCHTRRQCFVSPIHGGEKLERESSGEGWRWNRSEATLKSEFSKILLARATTIFPNLLLVIGWHPNKNLSFVLQLLRKVNQLNALSKYVHNAHEGPSHPPSVSTNLHTKLACSNQSKREAKL